MKKVIVLLLGLLTLTFPSVQAKDVAHEQTLSELQQELINIYGDSISYLQQKDIHVLQYDSSKSVYFPTGSVLKIEFTYEPLDGRLSEQQNKLINSTLSFFTQRGFKDQKIESSSVEYAYTFQTSSTYCTAILDLDFPQVSCSLQAEMTEEKDIRMPVLKALDYYGKETGFDLMYSAGDFEAYNLHSIIGGTYILIKNQNDNIFTIFEGQVSLPCNYVELFKIPEEVIDSCDPMLSFPESLGESKTLELSYNHLKDRGYAMYGLENILPSASTSFMWEEKDHRYLIPGYGYYVSLPIATTSSVIDQRKLEQLIKVFEGVAGRINFEDITKGTITYNDIPEAASFFETMTSFFKSKGFTLNTSKEYASVGGYGQEDELLGFSRGGLGCIVGNSFFRLDGDTKKLSLTVQISCSAYKDYVIHLYKQFSSILNITTQEYISEIAPFGNYIVIRVVKDTDHERFIILKNIDQKWTILDENAKGYNLTLLQELNAPERLLALYPPKS